MKQPATKKRLLELEMESVCFQMPHLKSIPLAVKFGGTDESVGHELPRDLGQVGQSFVNVEHAVLQPGQGRECGVVGKLHENVATGDDCRDVDVHRLPEDKLARDHVVRRRRGLHARDRRLVHLLEGELGVGAQRKLLPDQDEATVDGRPCSLDNANL